MEDSDQMQLRFWGVRGSIPTPTPDNTGFGGNTACLEIRLPSGEILIIDGGTGARPLGHALMQEAAGKSLSLHFFLTHFHWDHIQGIPFFPPLYARENEVTFYSMKPPAVTEETLEGQMSIPYFPVDFKFLPARRRFVEIPGKEFHFSDTRVTSFPLHHPQGCYGYRLDHQGRSLVFASDLEHGDPEMDRLLPKVAEGANVLIYDAQFTPEEYEARRGWGHSTWLQGTRLARQVGAKRLILFHHDPGHNDAALREILKCAQQEFPNTSLATEGEMVRF
jgi:phosphoribosyl 1,2-cyclic phosphodiesterase